jgi:NitT/TauT family transport system substrate-binding protein
VALAVLPSCASPTPTPRSAKVRIAPTTLPASAPVYVATSKGFFRDEGLDASIEQYGSGALALEGVLRGEADFALVADTPIARAVVDGKSPTVVAQIADIESGDLIIARKDRGIGDGTQLRGKRVGVLPGTSADFFLHLYLVTSGIDPADVTRVPLKADTLVSSLASGAVDAISAFAPYTFEAQDALGSNALVLDRPGLYTLTWNVAVRSDYATRNADDVARFLRALDRAERYIAEHPAEAQTITSKGTGISRSRLRQLWPTNRWTLKLDESLILTLEDEARWMTGSAGEVPDFLRHLDTGPLAEVRPGAVRIVQPKD